MDVGNRVWKKTMTTNIDYITEFLQAVHHLYNLLHYWMANCFGMTIDHLLVSFHKSTMNPSVTATK